MVIIYNNNLYILLILRLIKEEKNQRKFNNQDYY